MIVDSSAMLAVLLDETDTKHYDQAIMTAAPCRMSVANVLEASIVVESRGSEAPRVPTAQEQDTLVSELAERPGHKMVRTRENLAYTDMAIIAAVRRPGEHRCGDQLRGLAHRLGRQADRPPRRFPWAGTAFRFAGSPRMGAGS